MFLEALHASIGIGDEKSPSAVTIPRFGISETSLSHHAVLYDYLKHLVCFKSLLKLVAIFLPYFCHSYLIWSILFGSSPLMRSSSFKSPHF
jgi:hypothetical protein